MSCNTHVTLLTNFWLFPVTLSLPFAFRDSRNLCFALKHRHTPSDAIHLHVTLLADLQDHGRYPPLTLSLVYGLSLTSCSFPTLLSCVSHSCNITFLCFSLTLPIPLT